jgi:hypothetical protein
LSDGGQPKRVWLRFVCSNCEKKPKKYEKVSQNKEEKSRIIYVQMDKKETVNNGGQTAGAQLSHYGQVEAKQREKRTY